MTTATTKLPPLVQMYDVVKERVYSKLFKGIFFSFEETVRVDQIENKLTLDIHAERMPDVITFNGKEVKLMAK